MATASAKLGSSGTTSVHPTELRVMKNKLTPSVCITDTLTGLITSPGTPSTLKRKYKISVRISANREVFEWEPNKPDLSDALLFYFCFVLNALLIYYYGA
jgi:hypothetical protein